MSAPARHRVVSYRPSDDAPRSALVVFKLVDPGDERVARRFHAENAVVVAGMLRHGAMRLAEARLSRLSDFAAGYGPEDDSSRRMGWVPLPSVGHVHADGQIRRAIWLARAKDAEALGDLAGEVPPDGLPLVDEPSGECIAMAVLADPSDEPVLRHYLARATSWVSVTPVILPGDYGSGDQRLMNNLLRKALRESGIDPGLIEHAEFAKTGFSRQAARLQEVRLKDWKAKNLILYHLRIRFRSAVKGPIVLGRGRHFGLGLFCADPK